VVPPVTTYDIVDNVGNVSLLTGAAPAAGPFLRTYVAGGAIALASRTPPDTNPTPFDFGASVAVTGAPVSGDSFSVAASTQQDVFATVHGLITALRTGLDGTAASKGAYHNALSGAMSSIDNALNNVLTVRAAVGTRMKEVDAAQGTSEDLSLQYEKTLSNLQDLDYAKTISDLNLQQVYLQAAQKSFLAITSHNLFSML
jgi:flagellar hook-associated protein 3 FlgL